MKFEPNSEVLVDVISRRKIPERIPLYDPYYNQEVILKLVGEPLKTWPYRTKEECRYAVQVLIGYALAVKSDVITIPLCGAELPMRREAERTAEEKEYYLTSRDIPTIANRADYQNYPWPDESDMGLSDCDKLLLDTAEKMLPVNMGIVAEHSGIFERINYLAGYENYCYLLKDDPELLDEMAYKIGAINLSIFNEAAEYDCVTILHMGDDIACRNGVMASPQILRKWLFSWMKKYAQAAHNHKKLFTYHSDGNFREVAADIIDAGVDGKQAFEEVSYNVRDFKREYGDKIAVLGGIDVDLMARLPEDELRKYVRQVLEICASGGGYAIGSGNCFTSYIPVGNYMAMLEEAQAYSCK